MRGISIMHLKSIIRLALVLNLTTQAAPMFQCAATAAESSETRAYFLHIEGRALPLKQALVNGVNVLGGAVISLSLPVNISGYTRAGLNTLQLDYVSDPKSNLTVVVEKRTPGPKTEEIAKIAVSADDSKGTLKSSAVSFNLPADGGTASVGELSEADKDAIGKEFDRYYKALASAKAEQLRALYRQSLTEQRKLSPESARFFENVLAREVTILKNKDLKLSPMDKDGLAFKVEGDIVKLYRQNNKPLIESNEIAARIDPLMVEVGKAKKAKSAKATKTVKSAQHVDPAVLAETGDRSEKDIEIPSTAFQPNGATKAAPVEVTDKDGNVFAREISVGKAYTVFDGYSADKQLGDVTAIQQDLPVHTDVKERLVRFNLYFKPSKPDNSGKRVWVISLPPNV